MPVATDLPTAETLYAVYFARWIPDEDPRAPRLRSDIEEIELPPGTHIKTLCPLTDEGRIHVTNQLTDIHNAALKDLCALLDKTGEPAVDWVEALETKATPEQLKIWLKGSDPGKPDNSYLLLCCETGALIAAILRQKWPRLQWIHDFPYFESSLFDLNGKIMIPVFHWAVKTLSGDDRHPLKAKIEGALQFLGKNT
ncbi:MAG: hypothetical protein JJU29_08015 [Verrucomicrobia bacterium]|nr:hypothetical protein [Verrucomicrobiota bacterium]MCH8511890.1 hypothetical protein [Kiritimatiellia bacterium]